MLFNSCLHLSVGHSRFTNDGECLGSDEQNRAKNDLLTSLSPVQPLSLHQVADGDFVLMDLAGLEHCKGLFGVELRQAIRPWKLWRGCHVGHLAVPNERAGWPRSRKNTSHGLPTPGNL